jgi:hypothetical protein
MKKLLTSCLIFLSAFSNLLGTTHSKKKFLAPRPAGFNLPMELTMFHDHVFYTKTTRSKKRGMWKSHFQVVPFYQASLKGEDVGKYFGIGNGKNNFKIGQQRGVDDVEVTNRYFVHIHGGAQATPSGDFYLDPKQEVCGVRFDLFQFLEHPFKRTFIKFGMPIVRVENDPHFKISSSVADGVENTLANFFSGRSITQNAAGDAQNALTHAKVDGRRSDAGVADIDVAFGYRFVEDVHKHFYVNLGITLPTGNKATGGYLFEPIYGNGQHFALGFGIDASVELWKRESCDGRLLFSLNHRYLFRGSQTRTIPINSQAYPFAQYYLLAKNGDVANTALTPAANVLTQAVSVRPGNQIDSLIAVSMKSRRFVLDLGYNLFLKEGEAIKLKNAWVDDTYGIANLTLDIAAPGGNGNEIDVNILTAVEKKINTQDLDLAGATTPSQVTHKAFGAVGYKFHIGRFPTSFSFGASYEFAQDNHEFEGYAFWGKFGMSF